MRSAAKSRAAVRPEISYWQIGQILLLAILVVLMAGAPAFAKSAVVDSKGDLVAAPLKGTGGSVASGKPGGLSPSTPTAPAPPAAPNLDTQYAAMPMAPIAHNSPHLPVQFAIFDATEYRGKPDTRGLGFKVVKSVYEWDIYQRNPATLIPKSGIIAAAAAVKGTRTFRQASGQADLYMLDVERIPLNTENPRTNMINLDNMRSSYWLFKRLVGDGRPVGYYGFAPLQRPYVAPNTNGFRNWQAETNDMSMLTRQLDVMMPSVYTHETNRNFWVQSAELQVAESKRVRPGAKVYMVLMPYYFEGATGVGGQPLPADFWKLQLETAYRISDGVIIWYVTFEEHWNANSPWLQTTLQFMREKNLAP